ncbi:hypothetical protein B9Z19DRAFT_139674 [Tuber borchii]|uniref:Uncharacterized protein n=1 Tax=Tuber borchii TaxID=42251 RepID=A0A2T6ZQL6_TUBBO|nr:hypothetical protein B9Z19DRAFT_139674 [Tuber borchii]
MAVSEKQRNQLERDMKGTPRLDDILNSPPSRTPNLACLKNIQSRTSPAKKPTWGGDGFQAPPVRIAYSPFASLVQSMDVASFPCPSLDEFKKVARCLCYAEDHAVSCNRLGLSQLAPLGSFAICIFIGIVYFFLSFLLLSIHSERCIVIFKFYLHLCLFIPFVVVFQLEGLYHGL